MTDSIKPRIIGLAGPAGVGKDTVAAYLVDHFDYEGYAFAKPLKAALAILGINEPDNRADKESLLPGRSFSYRKAAQTLGTEWARSLDQSFWVALMAQNTEDAALVVISDVRFEDEADWIRSNGGVIWIISGRATTVAGVAATHASEAGLLPNTADVVIDNSSDLSYLCDQIDAAITN